MLKSPSSLIKLNYTSPFSFFLVDLIFLNKNIYLISEGFFLFPKFILYLTHLDRKVLGWQISKSMLGIMEMANISTSPFVNIKTFRYGFFFYLSNWNTYSIVSNPKKNIVPWKNSRCNSNTKEIVTKTEDNL